MAGIYDPFLTVGERRGMRDRRAALLADARGACWRSAPERA